MIYVVANIELKPGARADYLAEFANVAPQVRAKPGCIEYVAAADAQTDLAWQHRAGPDRVTIIEKWESVEALQAHNDSPHMQAVRLRMRELVRGRVISILTPTDNIIPGRS
jgi:quinol monooxygenase YgiN